jgi:methylamine---glutamate N-methyltransferase subunit A
MAILHTRWAEKVDDDPWRMCGLHVSVAAMCGIAGLFAKTSDFEQHVGGLLADMLEQLADRGPDSAGVALYRDPVPDGSAKLSLLGAADWPALVARLEATFGGARVIADHDDHAIVSVRREAAAVRLWLAEHEPDVSVVASGAAIELHKRTGPPAALIETCGLRAKAATHGLGHTRMATESRVTTAGSHPFSTGEDLCLVHNGSLSNHNRVRRELRRRGVRFATDNDSEVAAGYLMWRLGEGDSLSDALQASLEDLDGFFTFAVGTRDGFAVLRDPIACKPAVMAETGSWVAMASEYRAIAGLPGAAGAELWEPEPGHVYSWSRAAVVA